MKITCKNALAICVFSSKGREINPQICESNGNLLEITKLVTYSCVEYMPYDSLFSAHFL